MKIAIGVLTIALGWTVYAVTYLHPAPGQEITALENKVDGQTIITTSFPKGKLTFDSKLKYVGGQRFLLYNVANAEQHFFVEADEQKRVKRLYWVQSEGYLPNNTHTYDYSDQPLKFQHSGLEWLSDARSGMVPRTEENPNSDGARFRAFMRAKGYVLPQEHVRLRMVHLDAAKRNELMVIYMEDLAPRGLAAMDLREGGKAHAEWPKVVEELVRNAKTGMTFAP